MKTACKWGHSGGTQKPANGVHLVFTLETFLCLFYGFRAGINLTKKELTKSLPHHQFHPNLPAQLYMLPPNAHAFQACYPHHPHSRSHSLFRASDPVWISGFPSSRLYNTDCCSLPTTSNLIWAWISTVCWGFGRPDKRGDTERGSLYHALKSHSQSSTLSWYSGVSIKLIMSLMKCATVQRTCTEEIHSSTLYTLWYHKHCNLVPRWLLFCCIGILQLRLKQV